MGLSAVLGLLLFQAAPQLTAPERFFVGRFEGTGSVHIIFSGRQAVRDIGRGRIDSDGALIIDQVVQQEGAEPRRRRWRLVRSGPNRFTGTITDVRGQVAGEIRGQVLHLRYRSMQGPTVEQWITLHPNGRSAHNRMVFRRFGINVATVEETIRRLD
ncbi:MAG: DUF3833 family protein [Sphingomonas sp.]